MACSCKWTRDENFCRGKSGPNCCFCVVAVTGLIKFVAGQQNCSASGLAQSATTVAVVACFSTGLVTGRQSSSARGLVGQAGSSASRLRRRFSWEKGKREEREGRALQRVGQRF